MPQQEQTLVKVVYRDVTLLESSVMQDLDEQGGFIQTDRPMPVGTALTLSSDGELGLEVSVQVASVVELRKVRRGVEQPQPGMQLVFQESAEEFFQSLQGFDADETSFEMEAEEPPEEPGTASEGTASVVTTADFILVDGKPVDRDEYDAGETPGDDDKPPEIPEDG